ncbi:hypothetical protein CDL12_25084 [Handroanthus impetiginosus]|uniref:Pentacotripeptide-repeat region of PRORP domain-containing protein n=1 Tax=Handroanthus impetiginosus TaxID=429701 RepID=A0A2G9GAT2_9LAMI|nr:hypothetical protein CDL12_25084 [Handroanthus impetiginosus]
MELISRFHHPNHFFLDFFCFNQMANVFRIFSHRKHPSFNYLPFFPLIHTSTQSIQSIIDSLHQEHGWKTLSEKFSSVKFTNPLVQTILLQLKERTNSRKALKFFHWSAKEMHFEHGLSSYCIIIHILVKARLVKDAKAMFESVLTKHFSDGNSRIYAVLDSLIDSYEVVDSVPFVFDLFIQTCAKLRMVDDVLDACKLLSDRGFPLSVISFNTLLHVMQKSDKFDLVWGAYEHMISTRICLNEVTMRIMVGALCKGGKLERFLSIVDRMHGKRCSDPRIIVNTCLVYEMIEEDRIDEGLSILKRLLQKNMILDTISYSLVVFAKVKMGDLDAAKQIYDEMLKRGFEENTFVCSLFIGAYCEEGRIDEAIGLLDEMERLGLKPPDETFNHLIKGCSSDGRFEDSLMFCKKMTTMGLLPSCSAVNEMFGKLCENEKTKDTDEMLTILLDKGFDPDENTYSYLVSGYGREDDMEGLTKILFEMEYRSISLNMSGFTSAIISFCKCGKLKDAEKYLEMMKARSFIPSQNVYERLIAGHLQKGRKTRAHQLRSEMENFCSKNSCCTQVKPP